MKYRILFFLLLSFASFFPSIAKGSSDSFDRYDLRVTSLYNSSYQSGYNILSADLRVKSNYRVGLNLGVKMLEQISHLGGYFGYEIPAGKDSSYSLYSNLGVGYWIQKGLNSPYVRVECGLKFRIMDPFYLGVGLDEYVLFHNKENNRLHNISISLGLKF